MAPDEALVCVRAGADIIDCKDARAGALGALPAEIVRAIVQIAPGSIPVSATVGDLPNEPELVAAKVMEMAGTGVRYVKVGFFERHRARETIQRLGELDLGPCRLVGLLLADRDPDFGLLADMGRCGFAGAMIDTADKAAGSLTTMLDLVQLCKFVGAARGNGLFAGLAGSLRVSDIAPLVAAEPDVLGFRGALCRQHDRGSEIDAGAVKAIGETIRLACKSRHDQSGAAPMMEALS